MAKKKDAEKVVDVRAEALVALADAETLDELAAVVAHLSRADHAELADDIRATANRIKDLTKGL